MTVRAPVPEGTGWTGLDWVAGCERPDPARSFAAGLPDSPDTGPGGDLDLDLDLDLVALSPCHHSSHLPDIIHCATSYTVRASNQERITPNALEGIS